MPSIAIIGELNLDLIVTGAPRLPEPGEEIIVDGMELTLGSSSAISACQLARLGDEVLFISKVGGDDFGRRALDFLQVKRVGTRAIAVEDSLHTGLTISIAVNSERAMVTQLGCIQEMRLADVDFSLLQSRQHLHISSFYLQRNLRPDIGGIFARAKEMGLTTSLDTGWPHEGESTRDPDPVYPHLDVFLPNEAEAMLLSDTSTVESALAALAERVPTVVVKLGPEGAMVKRGDEVVRRDAFAVEVVDTTGAGDSFNAGFLHAYLSGAGLAECLDLGNACGALSTRAAGGTTSQPDIEEATEFIRNGPRRGAC
ncbi:MAG: carbohydrate kinase family protein [Armatimonadota bacterium]|nr:MAG: carbohydrate kinase family protein [Armatimonadota bacterium]